MSFWIPPTDISDIDLLILSSSALSKKTNQFFSSQSDTPSFKIVHNLSVAWIVSHKIKVSASRWLNWIHNLNNHNNSFSFTVTISGIYFTQE